MTKSGKKLILGAFGSKSYAKGGFAYSCTKSGRGTKQAIFNPKLKFGCKCNPKTFVILEHTCKSKEEINEEQILSGGASLVSELSAIFGDGMSKLLKKLGMKDQVPATKFKLGFWKGLRDD